MKRRHPDSARWVAEQLVHAVLERGEACKLWMTYEWGEFGWHWQPEVPTAGSARRYTAVTELDIAGAEKASDEASGWWSIGHLVLRVERAMNEARGISP